MSATVNKRRKILRITSAFVILFTFFMWASFSPELHDYLVMYHRDDDERDVLFAFETALRRNHPVAYDLVDRRQHNRIERWMATHEPQRCAELPFMQVSSPGRNQGQQVTLGCYTRGGKWYSITIDDIVIENLIIIDWGNVVEDF